MRMTRIHQKRTIGIIENLNQVITKGNLFGWTLRVKRSKKDVNWCENIKQPKFLAKDGSQIKTPWITSSRSNYKRLWAKCHRRQSQKSTKQATFCYASIILIKRSKICWELSHSKSTDGTRLIWKKSCYIRPLMWLSHMSCYASRRIILNQPNL